MSVRIETIRECLEGVIPGQIATCDSEGMPNLAYLSQVQFIDNKHVALSYQFFNCTRQNVLAGSPVRLLLTDHLTGAQYRLRLEYLRTETAGPLFEQMKAKLAGIASHEGMSDVFRLLGSDIYRIRDIEHVPGPTLAPPTPPVNYLTALRRATQRLSSCSNLESLLEAAMNSLGEDFGIDHVMLLMHDQAYSRLYTLASRGYPESGIGSEIPIGAGVIGICAREISPIRIGFMTSEYSYGRTVRDSIEAEGRGDGLESAIPLPGLPEARSQMAVPVAVFGQLLGVLYVESVDDLHFGYDDEDALVAFAAQLALSIHHHQHVAEQTDELSSETVEATPAAGPALSVRHFATNDSIFIDDDYLIKGVAGAILWALLTDFVERRRTEFTNKSLRVDSRIRLPGVSDNLEARLVLLQRRLDERAAGIRLARTGRGRFSLTVNRPLQLVSG
ncbi:GAF domain-containing protein [Halothiobacillus sp.]|uniref:GAF domain-containing protein n=1 Tax=Halothiobacillus sp. TaxID=1891311 RepID=UPI00260AB104|nr:GAF domain-containing protein [Halothiobacillus sp.]